jgi:hypothetical protein
MGTIMSSEQLVRSLFDALEEHRYTQALSYISDSFVHTGSLPQPQNKYQWVANLQALLSAMPDLRLGVSDIRDAGHRVRITLQVWGTHTADLKFPSPQMPCLPATGRKIKLPKQRAIVTVKHGLVVALDMERLPDGGIPGVIQQITARRPAA